MPGESLTSYVRTWPDAATVRAAARAWARTASAERDDVRAIGFFGSYARGDWGPGSDLDLVVVVEGELPPLGERARGWDTGSIPVPVDLLLYTREEWEALLARSPRMAEVAGREAVWLVERGGGREG